MSADKPGSGTDAGAERAGATSGEKSIARDPGANISKHRELTQPSNYFFSTESKKHGVQATIPTAAPEELLRQLIEAMCTTAARGYLAQAEPSEDTSAETIDTEVAERTRKFIDWALAQRVIREDFLALFPQPRALSGAQEPAIRESLARLLSLRQGQGRDLRVARRRTESTHDHVDRPVAESAFPSVRPEAVPPLKVAPDAQAMQAVDADADALDDVRLRQLLSEVRGQYGAAAIPALRELLIEQAEVDQRPRLQRAIDQLVLELNHADPEDPASLDGGFEEVVLQASGWLRKHPGAESAAKLATGPLADAVKRFEAAGMGGEQLADLMIHLFAGKSVYFDDLHMLGSRPPCNEGFRRMMALLYDLLDRHGGLNEPSPSLLETLTNLTTWMGQTKAKLCIVQAAGIFLRALPSFLAGQEDPKRIGQLLGHGANNTAGWLSEALDYKSHEDVMEKTSEPARMLNALHALATVGSLRAQTDAEWKENGDEAAAALFRLIDMPVAPERAAGAARAFLFMNNIPTAWSILDPVWLGEVSEEMPRRLSTAILAFVSAMVRATFNARKDGDEITSALFNLGVDIGVFARLNEEVSRSASRRLRVIANGVGLWWALDKGRGYAEAIQAFHGGDCAVNLFGALSEEPLDSGLEEHIRVLGETVSPRLDEQNQNRMRNSASGMDLSREINWRGDGNLDQKAARVATAMLLEGVLRSWGQAGDLPADLDQALGGKGFVPAAAPLFLQAFAALEKNGDLYRRGMTRWSKVVSRLAELAEQGDYSAFANRISPSLVEWGIDPPGLESLAADTLSAALRDQSLINEFFGLV